MKTHTANNNFQGSASNTLCTHNITDAVLTWRIMSLNLCHADWWDHYEALRKLDFIYQFHGRYDFVFSFDKNDFFNPQIPGMKNVKDLTLRWWYGNSTASCSFKWVYYFPAGSMWSKRWTEYCVDMLEEFLAIQKQSTGLQLFMINHFMILHIKCV